jgi:hypothetical protein
MMMYLIIPILALLLLASCDVPFASSSITVNGNTYLLPARKGLPNTPSDHEFTYKARNLTFSSTSGLLMVNGRSFGTITLGDVVDLRKDGVVMINSKVRRPL